MTKAHLAYLNYLLRHKYYVFLECLRLGVSVWQAIIHDWTKFTPTEWGPYVRAFYNPDGTKRNLRDKTGAYDPSKVSPEFDLAWLSHQRQKHHWQAWILLGDEGFTRPLQMPDRYRREMLADWFGAGKALGTPDTLHWYSKNKGKMKLHPETRRWIEEQLGYHT